MKIRKQQSLIALAVLSTLTISGCNSNQTTEEETSKTVYKTSTGLIDALGQLNVNGVTYDTTDATIVTDGSQATESDLQLGMVVSVTGTENDNGTGAAISIEYEDLLEGTVIANNNTIDNSLNIMGQIVHIDNKTKFASHYNAITSIDDIQAGNVVEVSGYTDGNGTIWATRVEVKKLVFEPGNKIEVKGYISNLTDSTFNIGQLSINYDSSTLLETLTNGLYVEVASIQGFDNFDQLILDSVNVKSEGSINVKYANNDEEVDLKGRITQLIDSMTIEVNGSRVYLNNDTNYQYGSSSDLASGTVIEVEGYIDDTGNFQAKRVKFENESDLKTNDDSSDFNEDNDTEKYKDKKDKDETNSNDDDNGNERDYD